MKVPCKKCLVQPACKTRCYILDKYINLLNMIIFGVCLVGMIVPAVYAVLWLPTVNDRVKAGGCLLLLCFIIGIFEFIMLVSKDTISKYTEKYP